MRDPDKPPHVSVARKYDKLLSSTSKNDIVDVRNMVMDDPGRLTPMTLMVLAIRLYDVGLKDESVFWFYAAKDRYIIIDGLLNMKSASLAQVADATRNFVILAGGTINGIHN